MFPFWIAGVLLLLGGVPIILDFSVLIGFVICFAGAVMIILYRMYAPKFPVSVTIFLRRHGSLRIVYDKATRLKHFDETFFYKL